MNRREALRRVALLTGAAISLPLASAILQGCESGADTVTDGLKYMTQTQYDVFNEIAGRIMPKTETPGAKEAGVTDFVDTMLAEFYSDEESKAYVAMVDDFEKTCTTENGKSFVALTDEEKDAYLTKVEAAAYKAVEAGKDSDDIFWFNAKQSILSAFFMSEVGKTKVQQHLAMPGPFKGCVPLAEAGEGRVWASDW
jgi:gluconate 2-dehydrogenase gamma chain